MKQARDDDLLSVLIRSADEKTLGKLILNLASADISTRRRCLDFLQGSMRLPDDEASAAEAESALALWEELEGDLAELDEYGGADDETTDRVSSLLYELLGAARRLEASYPESVLTFYRSGIGSPNRPMPRKEYAGIARVLELIRRVMLESLKDAERWRNFKHDIQRKTERWPAFQEEAEKHIPDWREGARD